MDDDWFLKSEHAVVSEINIRREYVTYSTREIDGISEVAIVSWFYRNPTLIALFHGTELVSGTLFHVKQVEKLYSMCRVGTTKRRRENEY